MQLVELAAVAVRDGRWPESSIVVAAIEQPPASYHHLFKSVALSAVQIVDCWSNPYGWAPVADKQQQQQMSALSLFNPSINGLHELQQRLLGGEISNQTHRVIIIDSLSPLVNAFGVHAVYALLSTLGQHSTSIVYSIHSDLHPQHEVDTLCYGVACLAQLGPANDRPQQHVQPHGRLNIKLRRRSGAVKTDGLDYRVDLRTGVQFLPAVKPAAGETPAPAQAPQPAAQATAGTAAALGQQLAGGMRLEVSSKEAAARAEVQLPYEHQGQGQLYAAGGDFRDYLPEAAGGRHRGSGRLGHILYVRDSDSEEPDSDEDPDDDLDI